jgi:hypothetical protein
VIAAGVGGGNEIHNFIDQFTCVQSPERLGYKSGRLCRVRHCQQPPAQADKIHSSQN